MNLFSRIRERIGTAIYAVIGAVALLGCGLVFTLFLAPQQKLEARRIELLALMDASSVVGAAAGDEVLVTGRLADNPVIYEGGDYVAYILDEWQVTTPAYDPDEPNQKPDGDWKTVERAIPDLKVDVGGQTVNSVRVEDASINGAVHETIFESEGYEKAEYEGKLLSEGSLKIRGLYNGDLITVWGKKAASGGIVPDELYAGDRVSFEESQHAAAQGLLIAGISMLVCSPVVLLGGIFSAIFGRRRR